MLLSFKSAVATTLAAAVALAPVNAAHAWGKNEQNFLKGVLATVAVGTFINQTQKRRTAAPVQRAPVYQQPVYQRPTYQQPVYSPPIQHTPSIYGTPAARAFQAYTSSERQAIQRRLSAYGYYRGGIDGAFGPNTYAAITTYARDQGQQNRLASIDQAFAVYDGLIY
jgi:hypothetical protein